jgi:DNA-binding transcriptional MerR regulator
MGFSLKEIGELFETYEQGGRKAQFARALPLFRQRLTELALKRRQIDDALDTLKGASEHLAAKLGASGAPPGAG